MHAVEFTTKLSGSAVLTVPPEIAALLPRAGKARIIILTQDEPEETAWQSLAYSQFLREDPPEDAIYDSLR